MSIENLRNVMQRATRHEVKVALESYPKYNLLATEMAAKHSLSARIGAAVFAALSPNNDYLGNLRDAERLLAAASAGDSIDSFKVSTYGHNKRKAWAVANGAEPLDLIVANKTRSFFLNVNDPRDPVPVTVDGHMINIYRNQRVNLVGLRAPKSIYAEIADAVRCLAAETGYIPCEIQAIVWQKWRNMHQIKSTPQMEMWDSEYLAANLGWQVCS